MSLDFIVFSRFLGKRVSVEISTTKITAVASNSLRIEYQVKESLLLGPPQALKCSVVGMGWTGIQSTESGTK